MVASLLSRHGVQARVAFVCRIAMRYFSGGVCLNLLTRNSLCSYVRSVLKQLCGLARSDGCGAYGMLAFLGRWQHTVLRPTHAAVHLRLQGMEPGDDPAGAQQAQDPQQQAARGRKTASPSDDDFDGGSDGAGPPPRKSARSRVPSGRLRVVSAAEHHDEDALRAAGGGGGGRGGAALGRGGRGGGATAAGASFTPSGGSGSEDLPGDTGAGGP